MCLGWVSLRFCRLNPSDVVGTMDALFEMSSVSLMERCSLISVRSADMESGMSKSKSVIQRTVRKIVSAPQSTATRAVGIQTHFCVAVVFLEQRMQMQNEKELFACALLAQRGGYFVFCVEGGRLDLT